MMIQNDKKAGHHDASNPIENPGNSKYQGEKEQPGNQSINNRGSCSFQNNEVSHEGNE